MPRGAIADPVERITPKERLKALSGLGAKAALWGLWDHRWLIGALLAAIVALARWVLGPITNLAGPVLVLWATLAAVALALLTPLGHELHAMGKRRQARRRIWGEWMDFCEDADCAQGPSGNRRAPYLLGRPHLRGATLMIDLQRIQGTREEKLHDLAEQIQRFLRAPSSRVEVLDGRVPDAYRLSIHMPRRRRARRSEGLPDFDAPGSTDWSQLDL